VSKGSRISGNFEENWSGRWESNPRPKLGKLLYCHCTTPAHLSSWLIIQQLSNVAYGPVIFHIFQNINFVAIPDGKCSPDLCEGNLSGVSSRHRSGAVTHLLAKHGGIDSGEFPSSIAAMTKGVHSGSRKTNSFECRVQSINKDFGLTQCGTVPRVKDKGVLTVNAFTKELFQHSQRFLSFWIG